MGWKSEVCLKNISGFPLRYVFQHTSKEIHALDLQPDVEKQSREITSCFQVSSRVSTSWVKSTSSSSECWFLKSLLPSTVTKMKTELCWSHSGKVDNFWFPQTQLERLVWSWDRLLRWLSRMRRGTSVMSSHRFLWHTNKHSLRLPVELAAREVLMAESCGEELEGWVGGGRLVGGSFTLITYFSVRCWSEGMQ